MSTRICTILGCLLHTIVHYENINFVGTLNLRICDYRLKFYLEIKHYLINVLFVKSAKVVALSLVFLPLTGCAIATGLIFASLLKGIAYSPDYEEVLFNYAALGFAFVESFSFLLFFVAAFIYLF